MSNAIAYIELVVKSTHQVPINATEIINISDFKRASCIQKLKNKPHPFEVFLHETFDIPIDRVIDILERDGE